MTEWFSARDLAGMKLPDMAATMSRLSDFIARIRQSSPDLVRPRAGRGGGYEVCVHALPAAAQDELKRRAASTAIATNEARDLVDAHDDAKRQMAAKMVPHLTARQSLVMEARAVLLAEIDRRMLEFGIGRSLAVNGLIEDLRVGRVDHALLATAAKANDRAPVSGWCVISRRSIYRWLEARDKAGIADIAPKLSRQPDRLPAWFRNFAPFYFRPQKPSVSAAYHQYVCSLPDPEAAPSQSQIRRALGKLNMLERSSKREGKLAMRAMLAYTTRDTSELLPTSVYVADGKTFDAEVAHPIHGQPFRPEITSIIDAATRRVVGWSASLDENTFGVVDALRVACERCGIPAIFYTDRGPGYKNKAMDNPLTGFLARSGITAMRALPYNSQAKGIVERLNHVYTPAAKALETYMGHDMDKEAKLLAFKTTRRELAMTGTSRVLPTFELFIEHIEATLAAYNERSHSGLPKIRDPQTGRPRHMTPLEAWQVRSDGFEAIIPDEAELDDMFRPYVVRKTRRALVDWLGNSYFSPTLEPLHGMDVAVGYDIRDASKVWVRTIEDVEGARAPGRLIAVATFEGHKTRYVPLSYEQAAMEKRHKTRKARLEKKRGWRRLG